MKLFDSIQVGRPKRNKFDLSHERKMSVDMGFLNPILCTEVLPGDSFRVNTECLVRMAPLLAPIMHRVNVWTHYFFVPNRLVWSEWKDFITGGREGTSAPVMPHFTNALSGTNALMGLGSLADFLGYFAANAGAAVDTMTFSALPFRAYQLIYDEYFRDQNLQTALDISLASGAITGAELAKILSLRRRAWEKDRFTSALPWAQRGAAVGAPITGDVGAGTFKTGDVRKVSDGSLSSTGAISATLGVEKVGGTEDVYHDVDGVGSLTNASVTINELRRSVRLQEWLEKNARGGARYVEQILSHFGVKVPDSTIQRPLYLGGGRQPIVISEVLANSTWWDNSESVTIPQGNMAGHGFSAGYTNGFKKQFVEHGYVIGLMSILPKTGYSQGVPKQLRRLDKLDFAWPEFANLGEEPILNSELYYDSQAALGTKDGVFGYQSRYSDYKFIPSSIHGEFRSSLSFWHMDRLFNSQPVLNESFVMADPTDRIFAVQDELILDRIYVQLFNRIDALRPLPYFGTPML